MSRINGVVIALVTDVKDPTGQGRIKVRFPWMSDSEVGDIHQSDWIRIAAGMGGNNRGTFFMPEAQDEALVAFEHGDVRFPYVVGFLWNGQDHPPADHVRLRRIQSVNGHRISFLDSTENNDQVCWDSGDSRRHRHYQWEGRIAEPESDLMRGRESRLCQALIFQSQSTCR
jgi:uncharacterized protein involved in type VI secretion and phage assembly